MTDTEAPYILAIDQGTTSTRAILFDANARPMASHSIELRQIYPANGWVEHDANEIWLATLACCRAALKGVPAVDVAAIGITNQRETTVIWDRRTGAPLHNAIVWQDRRTADRCRALKAEKLEPKIAAKTGLLLDPYFSGTKMEWLLDRLPGSRRQAEAGDIALGTIDAWLIFKLTGGRVHATDVTNASRTMLLNLKTLDWDTELLRLFGVPRKALPEVRDCAGDFGSTDEALLGAAIPILGVAGDQQAAAFGQACFNLGDVKSTYGTGCFALVNTGPKVPTSRNRLLATSSYRIGKGTAYAIEGSIFIAGAVVQWLRDAIGLIRTSEEIEALARTAKEADGLYFVPAFTGLGAPYWDPDARGAIVGLTRDMGGAEIARSALDAVCFQTRDLLEAMAKDMKRSGLRPPRALKVDGGMVRNDWFCQRLADLTGLPVDRPQVTETTALGAAYLAGLAAGLFKDTKDIAARWALDRRFMPQMKSTRRNSLYEGWKTAVARVR
ncbi:MAG: glycerol kinase GlpK [Alphaproteobacteria bacterium]|nr:glycerol kinase GlpK [Alphaproteobacteria bacterium]MBL7096618.1 glycerol kinase GlpK [Alphaproteobacteria bacterium]